MGEEFGLFVEIALYIFDVPDKNIYMNKYILHG